jgi:hypothetical protein
MKEESSRTHTCTHAPNERFSLFDRRCRHYLMYRYGCCMRVSTRQSQNRARGIVFLGEQAQCQQQWPLGLGWP